jgi:hypothetical protein
MARSFRRLRQARRSVVLKRAVRLGSADWFWTIEAPALPTLSELLVWKVMVVSLRRTAFRF